LRIVKIVRLFVAAAAFVLAAASCSGPGPDTFGQELYEQTCAVCHGGTGQGTPGRPAIGAGSDAATLTDEQIRGVMSVGPGAMPSFNRLSDEQVDSLVEYLRELQDGG